MIKTIAISTKAEVFKNLYDKITELAYEDKFAENYRHNIFNDRINTNIHKYEGRDDIITVTLRWNGNWNSNNKDINYFKEALREMLLNKFPLNTVIYDDEGEVIMVYNESNEVPSINMPLSHEFDGCFIENGNYYFLDETIETRLEEIVEVIE